MPAYLPNTQPKNNSTAQVRRRVNDLVSASTSAEVSAARLSATVQTKAPSSSPVFTGPVIQESMPTLTQAPLHSSANAGGATALPANPAAYTVIQINGKAYKLPLYEI